MVDLRKLTVAEINPEKWLPFKIDSFHEKTIKRLLKKLKLKYACPEFLLTKEGRLVFIDLNPCGDWMGFFNKEEERVKISHGIIESF